MLSLYQYGIIVISKFGINGDYFMKSITEKIFDNKAGFIEKEPQNSEYQKCYEEYSKAYNKLADTLTEEQKAILNELDICAGTVQSVMECLYFRKGLATGLRLGFEACSETDIFNSDEI